MDALPDGYAVRSAVTDDLGALDELFIACDAAEGAEPAYTGDDLSSDWKRPAFDLDRDTLVVVGPDGGIAAYGQVEVFPPEELYFVGWVSPGHRGRGLGTYVAGALERRAAEVARSFPEVENVRTIVSATDGPARRLVEAMGYGVARHFWHMAIDLAEETADPPEPRGITIARFTEEHAPSLYRVLVAAFEDHWATSFPPFDEWWQIVTGRPAFDTGLLFLAWADDEVVGGTVSGISAGIGWIEDLGVLRDWRGRGIGEALLRRSFAEFSRRGIYRVKLSVDSNNTTGATRLYERAGMYRIRQFDFYERPVAGL